MGMFDMVYYCPNCKKVQIVAASAKCPGCGGNLVLLHSSPKKWNALSEEERQAAVDKVRESSPDVGGPTFQETEYPITTTDHFDNAEITEYLGVVTGTDIYLVGGVLGGGMANQENLFGNAFNAAKGKMLKKAKERGGNAVVGTSVTLTSPGGANNMIVLVSGTAVKVEKKA
ncbi:YbjQ family protein [Flavonifractor sp. HCP28S3_F3]|uniref:YbjQ family protein n=1 Tax=Flavonifractor sp. HCP28S3_F3 TaxID=3438939 RepID=UPI003F8C80D7